MVSTAATEGLGHASSLRWGIFPPSRALSGAVTQVLDKRQTLIANYQNIDLANAGAVPFWTTALAPSAARLVGQQGQRGHIAPLLIVPEVCCYVRLFDQPSNDGVGAKRNRLPDGQPVHFPWAFDVSDVMFPFASIVMCSTNVMVRFGRPPFETNSSVKTIVKLLAPTKCSFMFNSLLST